MILNLDTTNLHRRTGNINRHALILYRQPLFLILDMKNLQHPTLILYRRTGNLKRHPLIHHRQTGNLNRQVLNLHRRTGNFES